VAIRRTLEDMPETAVKIVRAELDGVYPDTTIVVDAVDCSGRAQAYDFALWADEFQEGDEPEDPDYLAPHLVRTIFEEFGC
jgi:hypothetical protein